ncbi:hypothetical protein OSG_eHP30_00175 [environmental Halophage eHP-30]|nr:hypothetical protein OSG_eHP30_00175 [environmental Halophage eHP-30]
MAQRVNIEVLNKAAVDVTVQNSNAINVEVPTAPRGLSAEFTANQTEIDQGQSVDFSATNAGFQYYWEIQDTTGFNFKNGKNVSHQYAKPGEFDVALTQADLNQQASGIQVKRDFIKVNQVPFLLNQPFGTGATAAYSLRKLKSSATKAVRVREDASNTETDIGFSGAILDETALLNHVGSNNGFVTKWYDQSGNGNDASNSTATEQPQIVSGGTVIQKNGQPALDFDGSKTILKTILSLPDNNKFASFGLAGGGAKKSFPGFYGIEADDRIIGFKEDDKILFEIQDSSFVGLAPSSFNFIYSHLYDAGKVVARINQTEGTENNANTTIKNISSLKIGGRRASDPWDGFIQEEIFYFTNKNGQQLNFEENINNFYSIL